MTGIYKITNLANSKIYIGSSVDILTRFKAHKSALNGNYHVNPHLQSAWNKYGEGCFQFEVLRVTSTSILRKAENLYVNKYKCLDRKKGYNKTVVLSEKETFKQEETKMKNTVYFGCYSRAGKLVKVFRNMEEVEMFLGRRSSRVYESCNSNLTKTAHNYYWHRVDVSKQPFPTKLAVQSRKGRHRKIEQHSMDGVLLREWDSAVQAARELNLSSFNITRCLKGNNQYKNFKWFYSPASQG